MNLNRVILAGNLTRDPEMRYLPNGTAIANFDIAINRRWKQDGQDKEEATFVSITAFSKQAEAISQHLKKGRGILVEGRLKTETWDDKKTNQRRSKLGVTLESFQFVDGGKREETRTDTPAPKPSNQPDLPPGAAEDDVPF